MTPRSVLAPLLYAFLTLLTAFAVAMAGYLLAVAVEDSQLAAVLRIIGIVGLLLLMATGVLLLLALAVYVLAMEERGEGQSPVSPRSSPALSSTSEESPPPHGAGERAAPLRSNFGERPPSTNA